MIRNQLVRRVLIAIAVGLLAMTLTCLWAGVSLWLAAIQPVGQWPSMVLCLGWCMGWYYAMVQLCFRGSK